jgi:hypothetical protein
MAPRSRFSPAEPRGDAVGLSGERDVARDGVGWAATSDEPWLRLDVDARVVAGRWIELTYDCGFADFVARPLLRFVTPSGAKDEILPGASLVH